MITENIVNFNEAGKVILDKMVDSKEFEIEYLSFC